MDISKLDYHLPKNLIAQKPLSLRDHSKLLIINRKDKSIVSKHFFDLADLLTSDDVLVLNKTKVFPARIYGKKETEGKVEILLCKKINDNTWDVLVKPGIKTGTKLLFGLFSGIKISENREISRVKFSINSSKLIRDLRLIGHTPIPPYINYIGSEKSLRDKYQTIYAKEKGSIAAPTAGFHFTKELLNKLKNKGIEIEYITLHVGLGTFAPIKDKNISKHKIHSEYFELDKKTTDKLNLAKNQGKRIISVGTTTTRVLETCSNKKGILKECKGETNIYIYPPYKFKFIDGLITNFHLPKTTLLSLVSAFVNCPNTEEKFESFNSSLMGKAYKKAIKEKYRFYSFGDSSIIL
ncbi:tRNA preQ1(34) S-adenosylmethionine ribosyltransferase-isomerase QueA [Patescibacteria group bacterium]|nr:tRNA preQ1(34) S-adenosylmethionine ribosyltransferase-isomerase QueA [Patescibacteria group bacterium]MBU2036355.1 tRNA preQ1(34) S-adenosylmethionine ribosyltransferase-isomerase QueA [Patescibacteria group bacterium]